MKINEVITEAGFWKGVAKAIVPQTVQTYDRQKNALRTPTVDQDALRRYAKYDKFVDIITSRANAGQKQSLQTIALQLPKKGETANPDIRRQVLYYVAQKLQSRGIKVDGFSPPAPQTPMPIQPAATATPAPATSAPTQPTATNVDTTKIQAGPKPGLPTSAEQAKLQQAIQAQLKGKQ